MAVGAGERRWLRSREGYKGSTLWAAGGGEERGREGGGSGGGGGGGRRK